MTEENNSDIIQINRKQKSLICSESAGSFKSPVLLNLILILEFYKTAVLSNYM